MDLEVLAALRTRDNYEKFGRFVKPSSLNQEAWAIFQSMGEWFKHNPHVNEIDWEAFGAWFVLVRHAKMDKDKLSIHKALIERLPEKEDDEAGIKSLINGLAKRDHAARIADIALRITDGDYNLSFQEISDIILEYDGFTGKVGRLDGAVGAFNLAALESVSAPGLQFRMSELDASLGDLREGDFIIFGKRPDSGGTTWLASEASYMAEQLDPGEVVLWFNNEEQGDKVRSRIVQAALGWTQEEMDNNREEALRQYEEIMGGLDRIIVVDLAEMHTSDVNRLCEKYQPKLIIFDQLWKVKGFENEGDVERQTLLANWAREKAKKYGPVIAVHQAGSDADNKKWPPYSTLYMSKTGIQGEADAIIMMGRMDNAGDERGIWAPKNKLKPKDRTKRHFKWTVYINPDIARFESP